eukprot:jgi/Orpsp1_1/1190954/evm.model.d7180000082427.1
MPNATNMPSSPNIPSAPNMPSSPNIPSAPNMPSSPKMPTPVKIIDDDFKKDQIKEIKEAIEAADVALNRLHKARKYLNSSNKWGLLDFFGGGFISSMLKQGDMCDARRELIAAKDDLKKLNEELKDVKDLEIIGDIHPDDVNTINTSGALDFTDLFVDNPYSDYRVQSKIANAKVSCRKTISRVQAIKRKLEDRLQKLE